MEIDFPPLINFQISVTLKSGFSPVFLKDFEKLTVIVCPSFDHFAVDISLGLPTIVVSLSLPSKVNFSCRVIDEPSLDDVDSTNKKASFSAILILLDLIRSPS